MCCKHCCTFYNVNGSVYERYGRDYIGNIKCKNILFATSHMQMGKHILLI